MAVGRAERFEQMRPRVALVFGDDADTLRAVSDVFALMEMAWHDCHGEITPPESVIEDVLLCSEGSLRGLIGAAHLAVIDSRDLSVWASVIRESNTTP
jgi:hypothetical protein